MASLAPIPFYRPRLHPLRLRLLPRQHPFLQRQIHISARLLEFKPPSLEPIVLEKPDKFRPPSHPQRLSARKKRMTYGRDLNEEEKEQQDSKQYPYTFPPKKSFMHWFLHNRSIHAYISISVLVFLALFINIKHFEKANKFPELVPHGSLFFRNPFRYISEYIQVYRLHITSVNEEIEARKDQEVDDVRKRRVFREAHNLPEVIGLPARLGLGTVEEEARVARMKKKQEEEAADLAKEGAIGSGMTDEQSPQNRRDEEISKGEDTDPRPKRKVRKWFGIW